METRLNWLKKDEQTIRVEFKGALATTTDAFYPLRMWALEHNRRILGDSLAGHDRWSDN
jgi:hypothetical protein